MNGIKSFNLQWHQHDKYWIAAYPKDGYLSVELMDMLQKTGMKKIDRKQGMCIQAPRSWKSMWTTIYTALKRMDALNLVTIAVTPGAEAPSIDLTPEVKTPIEIQQLADSLWLGDALLEGRVMCYLQPVVSNKDKVFGYESFARVMGTDGKLISGDQIIAASKVLGIQNMIDRHLQVQAIKTFVSSDFNGFLFINFFPGFIQRPSVYLEDLSETVKQFGIISKHIVLEFTKMETPRDIAHIKNVCDYARSRGYSVALDDISSVENASKLVPEIKPDFVKLDTHITQRCTESSKHEVIRTIVDMAHRGGGTVVAEGVETEEAHQALKSLGVDLFQGYHFSPPVPVEAALKSKKA